MAGTLKISASGAWNPMSAERDVVHITSGGTAESSTVPAKATHARVCGNDDFWLNDEATAAEPSADVTDGTASWFLPAGNVEWIRVLGGATLSVISATTGALLSIAYYE
jgi:hypothetical protein